MQQVPIAPDVRLWTRLRKLGRGDNPFVVDPLARGSPCWKAGSPDRTSDGSGCGLCRHNATGGCEALVMGMSRWATKVRLGARQALSNRLTSRHKTTK
jgi:hypothetical protein